MEVDFDKILLEKEDLYGMHDTIAESLGKDRVSDEDARKVWDTLPKSIRLEALHWGIDDSVVRDDIYVYLQENMNDSGVGVKISERWLK